MLLIERIAELENQVKFLTSKIEDLSKNTEQRYPKPVTIAGGVQSRTLNQSADINTGFGPVLGNSVIFNNSELATPPMNAEPVSPTIGYNKHSHSRYSGGALIKGVIEIVEYDATWWATITNPHSQQFWQTPPQIASDVNSDGKTVSKIGLLDLVFNPDGGYDSEGNAIGKWGVAALEIDIQKCNFVKRRTTDGSGGEKIGDIEKDSKGIEMKGPLYNEDQTKTSIVWDENGGCWRLYAAYSPGTVDGT